MFYKYSGFRLTFRGLSHWSTMGGVNERVISNDSNEILHLSSTLINRNVRYNESIAISLRDPSLWFSWFFLEFRSESMKMAFDRLFRPSSRNFEKRNPFDYIARSLLQVFSPFQQIRFSSVRSNQTKNRVMPFLYVWHKSVAQHACAHILTHTLTFTRTQRPFLLYFHDIEKYVNLKKIYIYHMYMHIPICIYVYSLLMCPIYYITPIGSLNTLDTAWYRTTTVHPSQRIKKKNRIDDEKEKKKKKGWRNNAFNVSFLPLDPSFLDNSTKHQRTKNKFKKKHFLVYTYIYIYTHVVTLIA